MQAAVIEAKAPCGFISDVINKQPTLRKEFFVCLESTPHSKETTMKKQRFADLNGAVIYDLRVMKHQKQLILRIMVYKLCQSSRILNNYKTLKPKLNSMV
jgi:hypothetical protein